MINTHVFMIELKSFFLILKPNQIFKIKKLKIMKRLSLYATTLALSTFLFSCSSVNMNRLGNSDMEVAASKPRNIERVNEIVAVETTPSEAVVAEVAAETAPLVIETPKTNDLSSKNVEAFSAGLKELVASSENKVMTNTLKRTSNSLDKLVGNKEKLSFFDKLKLKLFNKILNRYTAKYGSAMDTADILAIVALCSGILTWISYYGAFLFGIAAIVTGVIAMKKGTSRRGMALAGIILGAIGLFLWLMLFLFVIAAFAII